MHLQLQRTDSGTFQSCCRVFTSATRWHQISFYSVQTLFTFLVQCRVIVHLATAMGLDLSFKLFNFITFSRVGYMCYIVSGKRKTFNYRLISLVVYILCSAR